MAIDCMDEAIFQFGCFGKAYYGIQNLKAIA
jgi:hypothetical protein